jgi:CubicO group peptidase (beta-lactamase class C family)
MNLQMDTTINTLLDQGIEKGVFPGAAVAVSRVNQSGRHSFFGYAGVEDCTYREEVKRTTFFDLASLSKALSTTLVCYGLIEESRLSLDDRLDSFFEVKGEKGGITIAQLLSHSSGMPSYISYYKNYSPVSSRKNVNKITDAILAESLLYPPGSRCEYSDLGFILLGRIIEKITGTTLDNCFIRYVSRPARLENELFYIPLPSSERDKKNFASTEKCPWRGRVIRSEVHDEHCWLMGGVSGHAGLFGTVGAVLELSDLILDQWIGEKNDYPWSCMLKRGLQRQYEDQTWCLGFDTPSKQGSSAGCLISPTSVGHLGYAGTSLWIDPVRKLVIVLLTNRVHPTRKNTKIREFRPYFHTRIIEFT